VIFWEDPMPTKCPKCGEPKVIPIAYGYPVPGLQTKVEAGEVILGGCEYDGGEPDWKCAKCGHQFVGQSKGGRVVSRAFDHYIMVDWSANSTPKTGKDSIWMCVGNHVGPSAAENKSTREQAVEWIFEVTRGCVESGGRVLVGFDFPFG
jgi:hypothetical protein